MKLGTHCGCTATHWVIVAQDGKRGTCERCGADIQSTRVNPGGMAFMGPFERKKPRWQQRKERFGRVGK